MTAAIESAACRQLEKLASAVGAFNLALIELIAHRLPVIAALELRIAPALLEKDLLGQDGSK